MSGPEPGTFFQKLFLYFNLAAVRSKNDSNGAPPVNAFLTIDVVRRFFRGPSEKKHLIAPISNYTMSIRGGLFKPNN
jgi:hypothetical protein